MKYRFLVDDKQFNDLIDYNSNIYEIFINTLIDNILFLAYECSYNYYTILVKGLKKDYVIELHTNNTITILTSGQKDIYTTDRDHINDYIKSHF